MKTVLSSRRMLKVMVSIIGVAFGLAGIWYSLDFLIKSNFQTHINSLEISELPLFFLLISLFSLANTLIATSWRLILKDFGGELSVRRANLLFSKSNLLKYVPGNILHIAGRQALAMNDGISGWVVAKSITVETSLLVASSAIFAISLLLVKNTGKIGIITPLLIPLLSVMSIFVTLKYFRLAGGARATLLYCIYHAVGGLIFISLFVVLGDPPETWLGYCIICLSYVTSWILGLITPGAPAGLGVREASLIGLLHDHVSDESMLAATIVLMRGISIIADVMYFLAVYGLNIAIFKSSVDKE